MKIHKCIIVAGLFLSGFAAHADTVRTVELTAKDGSTTVKGDLVSTRNGKFVIQSNFGVLTFDRDAMTCRGAACPVALVENIDMTVAAPAELADVLVPLLADGYAENQGLEARLLSSEGLPLDLGSGLEDHAGESDLDESHDYSIHLNNYDGEATAKIVVEAADGGREFEVLSSGEASLILSEGSANERSVRATQASGGGNILGFDQERVVAVDGYVAVVHPRNPIKSMTVAQVSDVISGKINNWSEFGGPNKAINVYSFEPDAEGFQNIDSLILKPYQLALSPKARPIHSNRELTVAVEDDRYGIGIVSYSSIRDTRPIAIENECGMVIEPTAFNIKTEEYTLQNRITLYSRQDNTELASNFLDYVDSSSLDGVVAKSGLISLSISQESGAETSKRLQASVGSSTSEVSSTLLRQYVLEVLNTSRLSTTFRFASGSTGLDNKALRDLERVLRHVEDTAPKRLVLAGFADSRGSFARNLALSEARAKSVFDQLSAADTDGRLKNLTVEVRGYGELGPVACNESTDGRATNRRVEIWAE